MSRYKRPAGYLCSPETRAKMAAAVARQWADPWVAQQRRAAISAAKRQPKPCTNCGTAHTRSHVWCTACWRAWRQAYLPPARPVALPAPSRQRFTTPLAAVAYLPLRGTIAASLTHARIVRPA